MCLTSQRRQRAHFRRLENYFKKCEEQAKHSISVKFEFNIENTWKDFEIAKFEILCYGWAAKYDTQETIKDKAYVLVLGQASIQKM